jgi:hypothetical protein
MTSDDSTFDEEWENRQLCSDGNCIGVIGPDGRCKECGKPADNLPEHRPEAVPASDAEEAPADASEPPAPAEEDAAEDEEAGDGIPDGADDWADRRLCPDGNCIGVIGPDGKCKECGRAAE